MSEEEKFDLPKSLPPDESRDAEVAKLVDAQHSGCDFSKRSKEPHT